MPCNSSGLPRMPLATLVSEGFHLELPYHPTHAVLVQWRSWVFGPFTPTRQPGGGRGGEAAAFTFAPSRTDMAVFRLDAASFLKAAGENYLESNIQVSRTSEHRKRGYGLFQVRHELVLTKGYERALAAGAERIELEPVDRKLTRLAKDFYTRAQRKDLRKLLDGLDLTVRESSDTHEFAEVIRTVNNANQSHVTALDDLAKAIVASGTLGEDRIERIEQQSAERYVQENIVRLQARIDQEIATKQETLRQLDTKMKSLDQVISKEGEQRRQALALELEQMHREATCALQTQQEEIGRKQKELDRQKDLLQTNLAAVTRELKENGDEVVNRFLTIAPLLGAFGNRDADPTREQESAAGAPMIAPISPVYQFPEYLDKPAPSGEPDLEEGDFLDRFRQVVADSGFVYRDHDLIKFHLSVKCGEITVVGGPSGTGKSSLPQLYSRALLGQEGQNGHPGCLMVNVSPSWLDSRDLLGHVNTLEAKFHPSESGLYEHLLFAQEEFQRRGPASGLYLACLDEMNLAQVEHYFSDFMMVLERSGHDRRIRCFAPEAVGPACPYRAWGALQLSPAFRVVGTANYDETTRLLSDRFLDRANMLHLTCESLPPLAGGRGTRPNATGQMVTLADFERWLGTAALPPDLGALLDEMRPILLQLGCPISPRVYRSICLFVGSAQPLLALNRAFDAQIAQRIVPKIRSLVTDRQWAALDKLIRLIDSSRAGAFDETLSQLEDIRDAIGERLAEE